LETGDAKKKQITEEDTKKKKERAKEVAEAEKKAEW
jgi:hypothetical protein